MRGIVEKSKESCRYFFGDLVARTATGHILTEDKVALVNQTTVRQSIADSMSTVRKKTPKRALFANFANTLNLSTQRAASTRDCALRT